MAEPHPDEPAAPPRRSKARLRSAALLGTGVISVTLVGWLATAMLIDARNARCREQVRRSFRWILIAFDNYADVYGSLPPSMISDREGKPLSSWRFAIMPFLEKPERVQVFDAPWDDERNRYYYNLANLIYSGDDDRQTDILAITGPGTAFSDEGKLQPKDLPPDLVLIVEARNSGLHWMQPGDFRVQEMPKSINPDDGRGISGVCEGGFHIGFADGQVWFLSNETPFNELARFFTIDGARQNDREEVLREYRIGS